MRETIKRRYCIPKSVRNRKSLKKVWKIHTYVICSTCTNTKVGFTILGTFELDWVFMKWSSKWDFSDGLDLSTLVRFFGAKNVVNFNQMFEKYIALSSVVFWRKNLEKIEILNLDLDFYPKIKVLVKSKMCWFGMKNAFRIGCNHDVY